MKRLISFFLGILLFFCVISGYKIHMNTEISKNAVGYRDLRTYERFWSVDTQELLIEDNTLLVFGSSELVSIKDYNTEVSSFLNGDDMNILTVGAGYFQSLSHAITLGALSNSISSNKVALFMSPQWFAESGVQPEAYAAKMSEDELLEFLCNNNISYENKKYVVDRTIDMLDNSPILQNRIIKYRDAIESSFSIDNIYMNIMNLYWNYRAEYECYKQKDIISTDVPKYNLSDIDFDAVLALAEKQGINSCTNNDFGIYDEYWDLYVAETYKAGEIIEKNQAYTRSIEYDDLRCFLNIAKELNIEVILVNIPVNGKWYEYQGILCDEYYSNIRTISAEYDNVTLIDMSKYEDEKYFLKDIMHLGWKGWARINEELYREFTQ